MSPVAAPRICTCGKVVASGQRCSCQRAKAKAHDAKRGTAAQRGYDGSWRKESKAFLALPGNERCACGCGRVANMVDHAIAPKGDREIFWRRSNWQPMNVACNSRKAVATEGGFGRAHRTDDGGRGPDFREGDGDRLGSSARHQPEFGSRE